MLMHSDANDGFRADYLDRGLTPHLLDISKKGLRAKSMKPIFPVCPRCPAFTYVLINDTDFDFSVSCIRRYTALFRPDILRR